MSLLSVKQAGERAGVSSSLVYQWCADGRLRHYRFGGKGKRGCIRIDEADLEDFLTSCRQEPAAPKSPPLKHIKLA